MIPLIAFLIAALIILPMFWLNWGDLSPPEEGMAVAAVMLACLAVVIGLLAWAFTGHNDVTASKFPPHSPAECSWKEVERDGQWEQTCDPDQKRLQR